MNKVLGGTPQGFDAKCVTCRNAHIIRGLNLQSEIYCRAKTTKDTRVLFPVYECSLYDDKRNPSLYDMEQIAWEVHSRNRGPVGFAEQVQRTDIVITPPPQRNRDMPSQSPVARTANTQEGK